MNWEDTPEEQDRQYLAANAGYERSLWVSWVRTCCDWDNIPYPTETEWQQLRGNWHHGKAPRDSVTELKELRAK